jgi:hypothetical protein
MTKQPIALAAAATLLLLAGSAAFSATSAAAASGQQSNAAPRDDGSAAAKKLSLAAPDLASRPDLIEAAKIKPVPPETLERALPAKVAGLARTESNKSVQTIGPVMVSIASARYGAAGSARTVEVTVLDPAGLPTIGEDLPVPAAGETLDFAGRVLRRTEIAGFPAVVADGADGLPSLLQVIPGGRIRVTMQGYGVTWKDLAASASSIDLAKLSTP